MMKNKTSLRNGSGSTSADITTTLHHYWNSDATTVWSAHELVKAAGDTSRLQPLLEAGHRHVPLWQGFSCETRPLGGGVVFRIFNHTRGFSLPRNFGTTAAGCLCESIPSLPTGVLYAVAGVAPDSRSAEVVWPSLVNQSAALYAANHAGGGILNGQPIAGIEHAAKHASSPPRTPWISWMAYDVCLHEHRSYYPDHMNIVLQITGMWLDEWAARNATNAVPSASDQDAIKQATIPAPEE